MDLSRVIVLRRKRGFTLIELLVVISIIALLLAILVPALRRAKVLAMDVICRQNLKQWAYAAKMYTQDYDDSFQEGWNGANPAQSNWWEEAWRPYYDDLDEIRCCPTAQKPRRDLNGGPGPGWHKEPFAAWGHLPGHFSRATDYGSYGVNGWIANRPAAWDGGEADPRYWRVAAAGEPYTIPVLTDMQWHNCWPEPYDEPPESEDLAWAGWTYPDDGPIPSAGSQFLRVVQNRHDESQNMVFMDWSVRSVGLKELWTLKWHREYDTRGPYTLAGGVTRSDWPDWMQGMQDY